MIQTDYPETKKGNIIIEACSTFDIREVYYDENGEPEMVTIDAMSPHGCDLEELKQDMDLMRKAFNKPIINMKFFDDKKNKKDKSQ